MECQLPPSDQSVRGHPLLEERKLSPTPMTVQEPFSFSFSFSFFFFFFFFPSPTLSSRRAPHDVTFVMFVVFVASVTLAAPVLAPGRWRSPEELGKFERTGIGAE